MSRLDWVRIKKVSNSLSELSPDDLDIMYEMMSSIEDVDDINDLEKLQEALQVALHIMVTKGEENRNNIEDLEQAQNEIKKLQDVKKELEGENAELQKAGDGGEINVVREKRNWDMEREQMDEEIRRLKSDNNALRSDKDNREQRIVELEEEVQRLRDENKKLGDNVEFLRDRTNQLKSQKDQSQDVKKSELAYTRSELRQKKIDLDNAQQKMLELHQEIDNLKQNLTQATEDIERLTDEYKRMKTNYGSNDVELANRDAQMKMLQAQIEHLQDQLTDKNDADDQIMNHVNLQVEKWKEIMSERDSEILKLYQENEKLRKDLQASGVNAEKANVQALIKLVKEREEQVKELSVKLVEATHTIEENCELISNLKKDLDKTGGGSSGHQMRRIKELRQLLDDKEKLVKDIQQRLMNVENQSEDKEIELKDALERNKQYEKGEYGLAEAVSEIKAVKSEMLVKDRQIENLCQEVNKSNYATEELKLENGHLRKKLGIPLSEVLDIEGYKRQKASEEEQEKATNIILQKEIEKLEDERLMLKKKVRILARQAGLRAGSAGMSADDVLDEIKTLEYEEDVQLGHDSLFMPRTGMATKDMFSDRTLKIKEKEMSKELTRVIHDLDKKEQENAVLITKNQELDKENSTLLEALKELKDSMNSGSKIIECPSLDHLLSAMETKKLVGGYDTGLYMKSRIDNLEGRNAELRDELRETRLQLEKFRSQLEKSVSNNRGKNRLRFGALGDGAACELEGEERMNQDTVDAIGDMVNGGVLKLEQMSGGMGQNLAVLSQYVVGILHDKSQQQQQLQQMDSALQGYRRKFAMVRHQQGLIYREFADMKSKYQEELASLKDKLSEVENQRDQDKVRLGEFDNLLDLMKRDDSEIKRELAEILREKTLFKVNEKSLERKLAILNDMEQTTKRENVKLKNEQIQIEAAVTDRMGYYQRYKETANFKLNMLQKQLNDSVTKSEYSRLQNSFDELTEKYRNFLDKENYLLSRGQTIIQLEIEYNKLKSDHEAVKKMLENEKQKRMVLEETLQITSMQPTLTTSNDGDGVANKSVKSIMNDAHLISITKKVATLEIKELNERERADHYARQYESIRQTFDTADARNKELEEKVSVLTSGNLELQKIERELRNELEDSVTKDLWDQSQQHTQDVERRELQLRHEVQQLREVADIARNQANTLLQQQLSQDKVASSIRQQILELESQSDQQMLIGRLHRLVLQLQMSEAAALRKLEESNQQHKAADLRWKRCELSLDEKEHSLFREREEARDRHCHLRGTINALRERFAGCIPLRRQEQFTATLNRLTQDNDKLRKQLQEQLQQLNQLQTDLETEKIQESGRVELANALKERTINGLSNEKSILNNWHQKMEQLRLQELHQRREAEILKSQVDQLESLVRIQQSQLDQTEHELVKFQRELDERECAWQEREAQLELQFMGYRPDNSSRLYERLNTISRQSEIDQIDPNLPLANQLELMVQIGRKQDRLLEQYEQKNKSLNSEMTGLSNKIRELESNLVQRERYITELRLRLPASAERLGQFDEIMQNTEANLLAEPYSNYAADKAVLAAQTTVSGLQERLANKDECIAKLEKLLKNAREDIMENNRRHESDVGYLKQMMETRKPEMYKSTPQLNTNKVREVEELLQFERRNKLELEQQNHELLRQVDSLKHELETLEKELNNRSDGVQEESNQLKQEMETLKKAVKEKDTKLMTLGKYKIELTKQNKKLKEAQDDHNKKTAELNQMINELKQKLMSMPPSKNYEEIQQATYQQPTQSSAREYDGKLLDYKQQVLQLQKELRQRTRDNENIQCQLGAHKAQADDFEKLAKKLRSDKKDLETENEQLTDQIKRIQNTRQLTSDKVKQDLDSLRLKLHLVEEENNRLKSLMPDLASNGPINKWEDNKSQQKNLAKAKERLADKEAENARQQKQLDQLQRALDYSKHENDALKKRVMDKWGPGGLLDLDRDVEELIDKAVVSPTHKGRKNSSPGDVIELKKDNHRLEKEIARLHDQMKESPVVKEVAVKEAEMRNRILQKTIDDLERRLVSTGNTSGIQLEKERSMQKEIIRLNGENLQLKFEADSSRKEIPRLKEKIAEQQKYVDLLKHEKDQIDQRSIRSESTASTLSNIRKVGESGRSNYELEKTIARMKKLIEKTQKENERLKEAPGVVMNEQVNVLRAENQQLKQQLEELRLQTGSRLAERYDNKERSMSRMAQDYEKMRRDLAREYDEHEKTKIDLKQMVRELEKLERDKSELQRKLEIAESRTGLSKRGSNQIGGQNASGAMRDEEVSRLNGTIDQLHKQMKQMQQSSELQNYQKLNYKYQQLTQHNQRLQLQLRNFSEQFGVTINLD